MVFVQGRRRIGIRAGNMSKSPSIVAAVALFALLMQAAPIASQVVLNEVLYDPAGVNTGQQAVEIQNLGPDPADIGGYWISFPPAAWKFPRPTNLPVGGILVVHLNRSGSNAATEFFTGTSGMRNLKSSDSLALFKGEPFSDPELLVDFVEWGLPGQAGEEVAVEAARWENGATVQTSTLREGSSIAYKGTGFSALAWCVDGSPSLGVPNDGCTPSQASSPVRINEMVLGPSGAVELINAGTVAEDLEGKFLVGRPPSAYRFPSGAMLAPGKLLLMHLGVAGTDGPADLYTGTAFADLGAADSLALFAGSATSNSSFLIDYQEWGGIGMANENLAIQAGLWTAGTSLSTDGLIAGGSLAALDGGSGPLKWVVDNTPTPGAPNTDLPSHSILLNEVLVDPVLGDAQAVEITNVGPAPVNLAGYRLCTRSIQEPGKVLCSALPPSAVVGSGGYLVVRLGVDVEGPGVVSLPGFRTLFISGDELALLVGSATEEPNDFLDYLRWGSSAVALNAAAIEAGIWQEEDSIDVSQMTLGSSIAYAGPGRGSESFRIDPSPSLGIDNTEPPPAHAFVRSDCNQDSFVDISDAVSILAFLFLGAGHPSCDRACDSNDDGGIDVSDPIHVLGFLFLGNTQQKPPMACGPQPVLNALSCEDFTSCP
jgi:lamin tail-like protein